MMVYESIDKEDSRWQAVVKQLTSSAQKRARSAGNGHGRDPTGGDVSLLWPKYVQPVARLILLRKSCSVLRMRTHNIKQRRLAT
jgi:hypothetical protein